MRRAVAHNTALPPLPQQELPSSLTRSRVWAAWGFALPTLLVLILIAGWPLARTIWFSFTDADLNNLDDYKFIGLGNYLVKYDDEWMGLLTVCSCLCVHRDPARHGRGVDLECVLCG
jgi:trehalose/maltose transport system permease protein